VIIRYIYTALLAVASPFLMWGLYRHRAGKPCVGKRWKEHFGVTPKLDCSHGPIWIHAVSVGETLAVTPLIKRLKAQYPHLRIVITTTTATGAEQAEKLAEIAEHRYMPFDFPFAVRGFINAIKPSQLLIMETELWPNTLHTVAKAGIPITVINARLSERSCQRYAKVQPIFDMLAKNLTQVLCQYPDDAERFVRLGIPANKVSVTGSIKFDIEISPQIKAQGQQLRKQLGIDRPVWIAASTHQGEDEQVLAAHQELLKEHPNSLLILVPRHPERFNEVFKLSQLIFCSVRRTQQGDKPLSEDVQVYMGDSMGEMLVLMEASDVCFMGGSLLGDKVGGHNMLEPAVLGKPVLTGPSYYNFTDIANSLLTIKAMFTVHSANELASTLTHKFSDTQLFNKQKPELQKFIEQNQGANDRTLKCIFK
jgi:3-deoxy-D-manno-octulosonic-acid transferase